MENVLFVIIPTFILSFLLIKNLFYNKDIFIVRCRIITKNKDNYIDDVYVDDVYFSNEKYAHEWANSVVSKKHEIETVLNKIYVSKCKPYNIHEIVYKCLLDKCKHTDNGFVGKEAIISYTIIHTKMKK